MANIFKAMEERILNPDNYYEWDDEVVTCYNCMAERSPHNCDWLQIEGNNVPLCRACFNNLTENKHT